MNMHGIITPQTGALTIVRPHPIERARAWLWRRRAFVAVVLLPVLAVAAYLFLIASDQYESEAHFLVRTAAAEPVAGTGVSQMLSAATGLSSAQNEAMSVADYLTSHDVVATLRREDRLVQRFHDTGGDVLSRLSRADSAPETLLKYYRKQVKVEYNTETGITTLRVHAFRPADAYELNRKLLLLGERRVNILNLRSYNDAVAMSRRQLGDAEQALAGAQLALTTFRKASGDIDPQASGQAQIGLVTTLTGQLAAARAQLSAMGGMIDHASPQYRALEGRVAALSAQVGAQSGRLVGSSGAIANDISGYEGLRIRQQFLAKRYEAAAASLEKAREQAQRQQLYVVRVVEANMPVKALFPQRWRILMTVTIAALLIYGIGWLIIAGVREHAA